MLSAMALQSCDKMKMTQYFYFYWKSKYKSNFQISSLDLASIKYPTIQIWIKNVYMKTKD